MDAINYQNGKPNPPFQGQSRRANHRRMARESKLLSQRQQEEFAKTHLVHEPVIVELAPNPDAHSTNGVVDLVTTEVAKIKKARKKKKVVLKTMPKKKGPKLVQVADDRKLPPAKPAKKKAILVKRKK